MEPASDLAPAAGLWQLSRSRCLARRCLLSPALGSGSGGGLWQARGGGRRAALRAACGAAGQRAEGAGLAGLAAAFSKLAAGLGSLPAEGGGPGDEAVQPGAGRSPAEGLALTCAALVPHLRLRAWLGASLAAAGEGPEVASDSPWALLAEEAEALLDGCAREAAQPGGLVQVLASLEPVYLKALEVELSDLAPTVAAGPTADDAAAAKLLSAARLVPPRVLIVAGSDSGGGAGIQADLKSCTALGAFGMTAIAALTAQNTQGVQGIFPVPLDFVRQQMSSVLDDIGADVVKTGMLATSEIVACVAEGLRAGAGPVERWRRRLVVDPVMVSTSGHVLLEEDAIQSLKSELFPMATIITPNLPEAQLLLGGRKIETVEAMQEAARDLCAMGPAWALVKGGHLKADATKVATDVLCEGSTGRCELFTSELIDTSHTHGTGCTLASSVAALLARGCSVPEAVREAKRYVSGAIRASAHLPLGTGKQGPMNHSWQVAQW